MYALRFLWDFHLANIPLLLGLIIGFVVASPEGSYIVEVNGEIVGVRIGLYVVGVLAVLGLFWYGRYTQRKLKEQIKREIISELKADEV